MTQWLQIHIPLCFYFRDLVFSFDSLIPVFLTLYVRSTNKLGMKNEPRKTNMTFWLTSCKKIVSYKSWGVLKTVKPESETNECTRANIFILIYFTHRSSNITLWPLASCNTWNTWSTRYALQGREKENTYWWWQLTFMRPTKRNTVMERMSTEQYSFM